MTDVDGATIEVANPSEYAALRTVIMCLANPSPPLLGMVDAIDAALLHQLREYRFWPSHDVTRVHVQQHVLIERLVAEGAEVLLAKPVGVLTQHYTRDIGFAIDDVFFVARPRRAMRQRELRGIRHLVRRMSKVAHLDLGTIEGGDVMLLDGHVLVGLGEETSRDGTEALGYSLSEHGIDRELVVLEFARRGTVHLDCALNVVAPGLALVHRGAFTQSSLRWIESHVDVIDTTQRELRDLRLNCFAVRPGLVVVERTSTRIADELERRGIEVVRLDYGEVTRLPGSFRCTTLPVARMQA